TSRDPPALWLWKLSRVDGLPHRARVFPAARSSSTLTSPTLRIAFDNPQTANMPGGVCAVLDYEVELMADYVSEMATRLVMPQRAINPAFRKFVSQILTSTRLPRTTILLGMNYLAKRINTMLAEGQN